MSISTRTTERWMCDRCGAKDEVIDREEAFQNGWLQLDLGRSLKEGTTLSLANPSRMRQKNEQILCLACSFDLAAWFKEKLP